MSAHASRLPAASVTAAHRIYANPITCRLDGHDHQVTDAAFLAGQRTGQYTALCGYVLAPVPMAAPPGPRCPACFAILAASRRPAPTGRHRRCTLRQRLYAALPTRGTR